MKNEIKHILLATAFIGALFLVYWLGASSNDASEYDVQPTHMMNDGTSMPGMRHGM